MVEATTEFSRVNAASAGLLAALLLLLAGRLATAQVPDLPGPTNRLASVVPAWLTALRQAAGDSFALLDPIAASVGRASEPGLVVITHRDSNAGPRDLAVLSCPGVSVQPDGVGERPRVTRIHAGDDFRDLANRYWTLLHGTVTATGDSNEIRRVQRALQAALEGDVTLLREQTVGPLRFVAVLPQATPYLPRSVRSRVRSIVLRGRLSFGQWEGTLELLTDDDESAAQVGSVIAGWRELLLSLTENRFENGFDARMREALLGSAIQVRGNRVVAQTALPATVLLRVVKRVARQGVFDFATPPKIP